MNKPAPELGPVYFFILILSQFIYLFHIYEKVYLT